MLTKLFVKADVALRAFVKDREGVTAIEYAVVAVAIAGIAYTVFGDNGALEGALNGAMSKLTDYADGSASRP